MSEEPSALHSDERRLAAILAADVAGYSRLMGRNEDETMRDLEAEALPQRASQWWGRATLPDRRLDPIPALWLCLH